MLRLRDPQFVEQCPKSGCSLGVADERGRLITDLSVDDIRILDDHFAVHRIRQFSRAEDLPLQIGLLLDVSDSVQKTVAREEHATQLFLEQVMRPLSDRAFLVGFGRDAQLWQASTGDIPALYGALQRIQQSGYATNLYDSVFYACLYQFPELMSARRCHPGQALAPGDALLQRLAEETGGQLYVASKGKDFPAIFAEMERQTPGFHNLRIETTSSRNLRVHARQGITSTGSKGKSSW